MRPAKIPGEVVCQRVRAALQARMDPKTHLVRPSWLKLIQEIGVCRQRIAAAVHVLKKDGRIKAVLLPRPGNSKKSDYYYEIVDEH